MRAGACAVQQTLTSEAASVLKHSLSLARRRGHAQVTPLHVAATLLSSRASLLRRACLKSQPNDNQTSHPLQCRALELCFNVALNRLPTTPGPLLHGQPSLSNALIAALKRAQAHQRRGCIEQQQQQPPLLAIKVELEQLIISILDDPSVSRVMREAGFSSTAVKNNLEDSSAASVFQCYSSSGGVFSSPCSPSPSDQYPQRDIINYHTSFWPTHFLSYSSDHQNPVFFSPPKKHPSCHAVADSASVKEDFKLILEVLLRRKRRNTVILGDSVSVTEDLVAELMGKVERGEVPEELKSAHFIKFQFSPVSLRFMKKEEVESNISDIKRKVGSIVSGGGGAILYAGDLKWIVEGSVHVSEKERGFSNGGGVFEYSPVDHAVCEIGRLLSDYSCSSNARVWLMATANYQTHMKCQMRQPPLEIQWALQAVSVPSGGLSLSLHASSIHDSRIQVSDNPSSLLETKPFIPREEQDKFMCCGECTSNYEKEVELLKSGQQKLMPSFLQSNSTDARQKDELVELRRKWNRLCRSLHHGRPNQNHLSATLLNQNLVGKSYSYASSYPWWSTQNSMFPESNSKSSAESALKPNHSPSLQPRFRRQQSCHIEFSFSSGPRTHKHESVEPRLDSLKNTEGKEVKITLALGNSLFSGSERLLEQKREKSLQPGDMYELLKENVPWQSEIIPSIVETLIDNKSTKKDTWLLISGNDQIGKKRLAHAIAESVFGSADLLVHMDMRKRENGMNPHSEVLIKALTNNNKLLVFLENVDLADANFMKFLADCFEFGKFGEAGKREGNAGQAVFILTRGACTSFEESKGNLGSVVQMKLQANRTISSSGIPDCDHKRKAVQDLLNKIKSPRIDEKENAASAAVENGNSKKELTKQLSSNTLDLNIRANDDDESEDTPGELSPISSDLTRKTTTDPRSPSEFLELIENRFVFNQNLAWNSQIADVFLSKFRKTFGEVYESEDIDSLSVEQMVLEEMVLGSGSFLNSLFEKWLKDVFQTSLQTIKIGGKVGIGVRLCFGGRSDRVLEDGFMGSSLPRKIQVSFMD
ncbi:protein SMAX1-LIKE 4-like [Malania oleifera]|uniref:protein SMAX1-LIKE 4-like n=1 Tax=Malania oleifera TaxID=397392 RepID=UPI0025AE8AD1|nr:protein SMAX1-LIKE 4-like [Malania oleifera]